MTTKPTYEQARSTHSRSQKQSVVPPVKKVSSMKRLPFLTFLAAGLALAIHASPAATAALQFEREALFHGEFWRMFSGHLTHFGVDHLRWDVIALLAFGSLAEIRSRSRFAVCVVVSAVVISLGVAFFQPQFATYRGLSGIDSALFAFVATDLMLVGRRDGDRLMFGAGALALAGFLAKCLYETATGQTIFVEPSTAFQPVPLAHLAGAVIGVLVVFLTEDRLPRTRETSEQTSGDLLNQRPRVRL
jgi:rhomboid family GlyGly-CTERM serine protease